MDAPDLTEGQKRNLYLYICKEFGIEWLLILDSDEYVTVTGDFKKNAETKLDTSNNHYIYDIMSRRNPADYVKYDPRPRLWYEPWDMRYKECHCCYGRIDGKVRKSERPTIEGIQIEHDKSLRSEQHNKNWKQFIYYQLQAESQELAVM